MENGITKSLPIILISFELAKRGKEILGKQILECASFRHLEKRPMIRAKIEGFVNPMKNWTVFNSPNKKESLNIDKECKYANEI